MFFIYIYIDNFEHTFALWITPTTGVKRSSANVTVKYIYNFSPATFPGNFTYSNIIRFGRKGFIAGENHIKKMREENFYKERG